MIYANWIENVQVGDPLPLTDPRRFWFVAPAVHVGWESVEYGAQADAAADVDGYGRDWCEIRIGGVVVMLLRPGSTAAAAVMELERAAA